MYLKTLKTSQTAKIFDKINQRRLRAMDYTANFVAKLGFKRYRVDPGYLSGGVISFCVEENCKAPKWLKKSTNENHTEEDYVLNLDVKNGKKLAEQIAKLPKVTYEQFNNCLNIIGSETIIGFDECKDYYLFQVDDNTDKSILPIDCTIITEEELTELLKTI